MKQEIADLKRQLQKLTDKKAQAQNDAGDEGELTKLKKLIEKLEPAANKAEAGSVKQISGPAAPLEPGGNQV